MADEQSCSERGYLYSGHVSYCACRDYVCAGEQKPPIVLEGGMIKTSVQVTISRRTELEKLHKGRFIPLEDK